MKVTVTTGASDRRMAKPADLVVLDSSLTTATARAWLDAAGAVAEGSAGLRYPPWRQSYTLRLPGTDSTSMKLHAKPVETVTLTDLDAVSIPATDYTLISNGQGILDRVERSVGWGRLFAGGIGVSRLADPESEKDAFIATTTSGWLMPGQVSTWAAATAYKAEPASTSYDDPATGGPYAVGAWVRSADTRVTLRFECTTAGTSDAAEPAEFTDSSTVAGDTITDNTAAWTARATAELPADLSGQILRLALYLYQTADPGAPGEIKREEEGGADVEYFAAGTGASGMPTQIAIALEAYR